MAVAAAVGLGIALFVIALAFIAYLLAKVAIDLWRGRDAARW